jgi:dipeptidyl-peptidase 4
MSYPLRSAITRRFTLGAPRSAAVIGPEGRRGVLWVRSDGPEDAVNHLWHLDVTSGIERRLLDGRLGGDESTLPAEERARRERVREQAGGVTAYSVDRDGTTVAVALGGQLLVVDVELATVQELALDVAVFDPRISPDGRRVALHHDDGVTVVDLHAAAAGEPATRRLVEEPGVAWGRAEFVAAEEMGRLRGMWWSPDGRRLAVARVDESAVPIAHLVDPSRPEQPGREIRYPFAGAANAHVTLAILDVEDGRRTDLDLAAAAGPEDVHYLARVDWRERLLVGVQPRDQRALHVLEVEPDDGSVRALRRITAAPWVELVEGSPAWCGGLLTVEDVDGPGGLRRALCRDGMPVTPEGVDVRGVLSVHPGMEGAGTVLLSVTLDDPTSLHVVPVRLAAPGGTSDGGSEASAEVGAPLDASPGVHHVAASARADGTLDVAVVRRVDLTLDAADVAVVRFPVDEDAPLRAAPRAASQRGGGPEVLHRLASVAERPDLDVRPTLLQLGARGLHAALLLPRRGPAASSSGPLPVVLDPYAGPHAQRVLQARAAHHGSQWLADQGFAVLVVDGRGTPGRGPAFEHAVHHDLAGPALEDQLDALEAAAAIEPRMDLGRVGVRGWSYGGTLAALAALRRPDRIHCAVVGAPVTDWRLYDTHYTERYLGHPVEHADAYVLSGIVDVAGRLVAPDEVARDARPAELLVVHGLADDNVLVAHSLRLTEALLAAGHPFSFIPLTNATHMASDPSVAARLLEAQVAFLQRCLGVAAR